MSRKALLIGNNHYPDISDLRYAENDASAVAESLKRNYGFRKEDIVLMTSRQKGSYYPSRERIRDKLNALCKEYSNTTERLDLLLIGFFGHGFRCADGKRYLCGTDADEKRLQDTALSLDFVLSCVGEIGASTTALFLDCCQNVPLTQGGVDNTFTQDEEDSLRQSVRDARDVIAKRPGVQPTVAILNACSPGECAHPYEEKEHGAFSYYLLEALNNRLATADDCFRYVYEQMNGGRFQQVPSKYVEGGVARLAPCGGARYETFAAPVEPRRRGVRAFVQAIALTGIFAGGIVVGNKIFDRSPAPNPTVPTPVVDKKDGDQTAKEATEQAAAEQTAKEAAEKVAAEQAAKETAEQAAAEQAAKEAAEQAAAEQAAKEAAEKAAAEQAPKEAEEKAAAEQAAKEAEEKAAAEQAAKEAADKAAAEQAAKEEAEKRAEDEQKRAEAEKAAKEAAERETQILLKGYPLVLEAELLANQGEYSQAREKVGEALALGPSGQTLSEWTAKSEEYARKDAEKKAEDEKNRAEAEIAAREAAELLKNNIVKGHAFATEAQALKTKGDYTQALDKMDQALRLNVPEDTLKPWRDMRESIAEEKTLVEGWGDTNARAAGTAKTLTLKDVDYRLHWAPAGTFMMGSSESERKLVAEEYDKACDGKFVLTTLDDEILHEVKLSRGFWMMETEVTQRMYTSLIGKNPSWYCKDGNGAEQVKGKSTDEFPVECVSWDDCQEFIKKLNAEVSKIDPTLRFRLPTEAEWEYACRGGGDYRYSGSDNLDEVGWFDPKYFEHNEWDKEEKIWRFKDDYVTPGPHKVGGKKPNAWGLYDMSGNVAEWVQDWYSANAYSEGRTTDPQGPDRGLSRVGRGGGWGNLFASCRRANRVCYSPAGRDSNLGFRLVLESSKEKEE